MLQRVMRPSMSSARTASPAVFNDTAGAATDADFRDDREREILRTDAGLQFAVRRYAQGLRLSLKQALCREHVADFGRTDAERERAERAMCCGVAFATDNDAAPAR